MSQIPLYVYVVFLLLVYLGSRYLKPRKIRLSRLALMPVLITYLGIRGYAGLFPALDAVDLAAAVAGASLGFVVGWHHASRWTLEFDKSQRTIYSPGDAMMLVIILLIFGFEFALHYGADSHAHWFTSAFVAPFAAAVWSMFVCMSVGRNLNMARRYYASEAIGAR